LKLTSYINLVVYLRSGVQLAEVPDMNVAVSTWFGRVSPVFDVARVLLVVEFRGHSEVGREEAHIDETSLAARARRLDELGVDVLVCGAISAPLEQMLLASGVRVIPRICGPVEDVLRAFASERIADVAFRMPGCCGRPQRRHRGAGREQRR